jgi:2-keto-4-pentenoate hydratase/2-oxohepta-3-ene-1,7-dioic acid hydratase in catechol pathway
MRLVSFRENDRLAAGALLDDDEVVHIGEAVGRPDITTRQLLTTGASGRELIDDAVRRATRRRRLDALTLAAPVPDPSKFLGLGFSFRAHLDELHAKMPQFVAPKNQIWFNKQVSCVNGPFDPIVRPRVSEQLDYEGELAVVIGTACRHVRRDRAAEVIAGYMICNDVSVRDWQLRSPTATLGKSFDTHGPIGPWLTLGMTLEDAGHRQIRTFVNGELRQNGNTEDFIYSIGEMIEELTSVFTLQPGDILATGTPPGVGGLMNPPRYLKAGDVVRVEIDDLGSISNPVIEESTAAS